MEQKPPQDPPPGNAPMANQIPPQPNQVADEPERVPRVVRFGRGRRPGVAPQVQPPNEQPYPGMIDPRLNQQNHQAQMMHAQHMMFLAQQQQMILQARGVYPPQMLVPPNQAQNDPNQRMLQLNQTPVQNNILQPPNVVPAQAQNGAPMADQGMGQENQRPAQNQSEEHHQQNMTPAQASKEGKKVNSKKKKAKPDRPISREETERRAQVDNQIQQQQLPQNYMAGPGGQMYAMMHQPNFSPGHNSDPRHHPYWIPGHGAPMANQNGPNMQQPNQVPIYYQNQMPYPAAGYHPHYMMAAQAQNGAPMAAQRMYQNQFPPQMPYQMMNGALQQVMHPAPQPDRNLQAPSSSDGNIANKPDQAPIQVPVRNIKSEQSPDQSPMANRRQQGDPQQPNVTPNQSHSGIPRMAQRRSQPNQMPAQVPPAQMWLLLEETNRSPPRPPAQAQHTAPHQPNIVPAQAQIGVPAARPVKNEQQNGTPPQVPNVRGNQRMQQPDHVPAQARTMGPQQLAVQVPNEASMNPQLMQIYQMMHARMMQNQEGENFQERMPGETQQPPVQTQGDASIAAQRMNRLNHTPSPVPPTPSLANTSHQTPSGKTVKAQDETPEKKHPRQVPAQAEPAGSNQPDTIAEQNVIEALVGWGRTYEQQQMTLAQERASSQERASTSAQPEGSQQLLVRAPGDPSQNRPNLTPSSVPPTHPSANTANQTPNGDTVKVRKETSKRRRSNQVTAQALPMGSDEPKIIPVQAPNGYSDLLRMYQEHQMILPQNHIRANSQERTPPQAQPSGSQHPNMAPIQASGDASRAAQRIQRPNQTPSPVPPNPQVPARAQPVGLNQPSKTPAQAPNGPITNAQSMYHHQMMLANYQLMQQMQRMSPQGLPVAPQERNVAPAQSPHGVQMVEITGPVPATHPLNNPGQPTPNHVPRQSAPMKPVEEEKENEIPLATASQINRRIHQQNQRPAQAQPARALQPNLTQVQVPNDAQLDLQRLNYPQGFFLEQQIANLLQGMPAGMPNVVQGANQRMQQQQRIPPARRPRAPRAPARQQSNGMPDPPTEPISVSSAHIPPQNLHEEQHQAPAETSDEVPSAKQIPAQPTQVADGPQPPVSLQLQRIPQQNHMPNQANQVPNEAPVVDRGNVEPGEPPNQVPIVHQLPNHMSALDHTGGPKLVNGAATKDQNGAPMMIHRAKHQNQVPAQDQPAGSQNSKAKPTQEQKVVPTEVQNLKQPKLMLPSQMLNQGYQEKVYRPYPGGPQCIRYVKIQDSVEGQVANIADQADQTKSQMPAQNPLVENQQQNSIPAEAPNEAPVVDLKMQPNMMARPGSSNRLPKSAQPREHIQQNVETVEEPNGRAQMMRQPDQMPPQAQLVKLYPPAQTLEGSPMAPQRMHPPNQGLTQAYPDGPQQPDTVRNQGSHDDAQRLPQPNQTPTQTPVQVRMANPGSNKMPVGHQQPNMIPRQQPRFRLIRSGQAESNGRLVGPRPVQVEQNEMPVGPRQANTMPQQQPNAIPGQPKAHPNVVRSQHTGMIVRNGTLAPAPRMPQPNQIPGQAPMQLGNQGQQHRIYHAGGQQPNRIVQNGATVPVQNHIRVFRSGQGGTIGMPVEPCQANTMPHQQPHANPGQPNVQPNVDEPQQPGQAHLAPQQAPHVLRGQHPNREPTQQQDGIPDQHNINQAQHGQPRQLDMIAQNNALKPAQRMPQPNRIPGQVPRQLENQGQQQRLYQAGGQQPNMAPAQIPMARPDQVWPNGMPVGAQQPYIMPQQQANPNPGQPNIPGHPGRHPLPNMMAQNGAMVPAQNQPVRFRLIRPQQPNMMPAQNHPMQMPVMMRNPNQPQPQMPGVPGQPLPPNMRPPMMGQPNAHLQMVQRMPGHAHPHAHGHAHAHGAPQAAPQPAAPPAPMAGNGGRPARPPPAPRIPKVSERKPRVYKKDIELEALRVEFLSVITEANNLRDENEKMAEFLSRSPEEHEKKFEELCQKKEEKMMKEYTEKCEGYIKAIVKMGTDRARVDEKVKIANMKWEDKCYKLKEVVKEKMRLMNEYRDRNLKLMNKQVQEEAKKNGEPFKWQQCEMCLTLYSNQFEKTPRTLGCGHTYCLTCCRKLRERFQITCPVDGKVTKLEKGDIHRRLPKNFAVLAMCGH